MWRPLFQFQRSHASQARRTVWVCVDRVSLCEQKALHGAFYGGGREFQLQHVSQVCWHRHCWVDFGRQPTTYHPRRRPDRSRRVEGGPNAWWMMKDVGFSDVKSKLLLQLLRLSRCCVHCLRANAAPSRVGCAEGAVRRGRWSRFLKSNPLFLQLHVTINPSPCFSVSRLDAALG